MPHHDSSSFQERLDAVVVRTLDAVERTNRVLDAARDRVTLSGRWGWEARYTRRAAVAAVAAETRRDPVPAAPNPALLHERVQDLLARAAGIAGSGVDGALDHRLAIAEAAARDTRHWLLDEPRHTPESLRDIGASVQAIARTLEAIEADRRAR
jgi:hypothetical protein